LGSAKIICQDVEGGCRAKLAVILELWEAAFLVWLEKDAWRVSVVVTSMKWRT